MVDQNNETVAQFLPLLLMFDAPLPLRKGLQEEVEISQYEMGQPFKTCTHHEWSVTAFAYQDATGHLWYALFSCGDFSHIPVATLLFSRCHLPFIWWWRKKHVRSHSFTLTIKSSNKNEEKGEMQPWGDPGEDESLLDRALSSTSYTVYRWLKKSADGYEPEREVTVLM